MSIYREATKEDHIRTAVYLSFFVIAVLAGAVLLVPAYWYIWLILVAGGLFLLVRWHARTFAYRCPECRYKFEISTFTDLISPHGADKSGGWTYLKCPRCKRRSRAVVIKKIK